MTTAIITHRVADYDAWRTVYDEFGETRDSFGVKGEEVLRLQEDPRTVIVRHDFADKKAAEAFLSASELREAMGRAGVDESSVQIQLAEPA